MGRSEDWGLDICYPMVTTGIEPRGVELGLGFGLGFGLGILSVRVTVTVTVTVTVRYRFLRNMSSGN